MFSNLRAFKRAPLFSFRWLLALALFFIVGCSSNLGEKPPPADVQTFGGAQCLSDALPVVTSFIEGKATDSEVANAWDCFGSAIEQFKKRVIGKSVDGYTSSELSIFLQDNFFKFKNGQKISPQLQDEVMKIKQLLIGGSRTSLSRKELDDAVVLIRNLKAITLKLNPYMKVYSLNWSLSSSNNLQADTTYFENSNVTLQEVARDLAALVQKNNQGYDLSDFPIFVRELNSLYDHPWSFVEKVSQFIPVVKKVKKAIAGGDENQVIPQEWLSFLLLGSRGYVQYMRYYYFISSAINKGSGIPLGYIARVTEDTLSIFQDLVAVKPTGLVSKIEVAELLKAFSAAWPSFKVSDNLISEGMKIKQLLIGGSRESLTANDFGSARGKVGQVKAVVEKFLPYYAIYSLDWDRNGLSAEQEQSQFNDAQVNLEQAGQGLAALLETSYDVNDFYALAHEVIVLYGSGAPEDNPVEQALKKYLPVFVDVKNMTFSDSDSLIKKAQWAPTLLMVARGYSLYMYNEYFYKGLSFKSPAGLQVTQLLVDRGLNLGKDLLAINPQKKFNQSDVTKLAQRVGGLGIFPDAFNDVFNDTRVVSIVVDTLLNRFLLSPIDRLNGKVPQALTAASVEILRFEVQGWLGLELFYTELFPNGDESYTASQIRKIISRQRSAEGTKTALGTALNELSMMLNSPVPLTIDASSHLYISNRSTLSYKLRSLSQLNLNRIIARTLIRAYSQSLDRINEYQGITLGEAQRAFAQLKPVGVQLGLLDPVGDSFPDSRFREANIFSARADGNGLASFLETSDLIGMIWSGVNINSELRKDLIARCLNGRRDVKDYVTTVSVDCAFQVYTDRMPAYMSSMPSFLSYMANANSEQWSAYFINALKAAGYVPNDSGRAKLGDVALLPHVVQYIEMVYAKYDEDGNNVIDAKEALAAFPSFQNIMKDLAKGQVPDDELDDIFTYILKFGKPPETVSEKLKYGLNWRNKPDKWDIQADRTQIAKILGYIADQLAKPPAENPKARKKPIAVRR